MIFLCVALACLAQSGQALAACTFGQGYRNLGGVRGWGARVQNSSHAALRAAFADGTCEYRAGAHGGGQIPAGAASDRHVTIRAGNRMCHVFIRRAGVAGPYFPTTCIPP
jgi:hypothetical protein